MRKYRSYKTKLTCSVSVIVILELRVFVSVQLLRTESFGKDLEFGEVTNF